MSETSVLMWVDAAELMPQNGRKVIVFFVNPSGRPRTIMAMYAAKHTLELGEDLVGGCECCNCPEDSDRVWCPESWYEMNEFEETHWWVDGTVTHWMPLPPPPVNWNQPPIDRKG